jgi:hypothetical protein
VIFEPLLVHGERRRNVEDVRVFGLKEVGQTST